MTIEVVPYHFALVNSAVQSIIECITLLNKCLTKTRKIKLVYLLKIKQYRHVKVKMKAHTSESTHSLSLRKT